MKTLEQRVEFALNYWPGIGWHELSRDLLAQIRDLEFRLAVPVAEDVQRMADDMRNTMADHSNVAEMLESLARRVGELEKDKARLEWLDAQNQAINKRYGTRYGWKYDVNHNRARLSDSHIPALSVREAIDAAIAAQVAMQPGKADE